MRTFDEDGLSGEFTLASSANQNPSLIIHWPSSGRGIRFFVLFLSILLAFSARANPNPYQLSFGGRIVESSGRPYTGGFSLKVDFYHEQELSGPILSLTEGLESVPLSDDGVFQITISLTPQEFNKVFVDVTQPVYVSLTDLTHGQSTPFHRQQLMMVPYAGRVPVDGKTVRFNTEGQLTIGPTIRPKSGQFLTMDASGSLVWSTPTFGGVSSSNTSQIIGPSRPSGVNSTGSDLILRSGPGTGFASPGNLLFQTGTAGLEETISSQNSGGTTRMIVTAEGNVGIGTSQPNAVLTVNQLSSPSQTQEDTGAQNLLELRSEDAAGSLVFKASGGEKAYLSLETIWDAETQIDNTRLPLLLLPEGGNVGIGTESPQAKLSVYGGSVSVLSGDLLKSAAIEIGRERPEYSLIVAGSPENPVNGQKNGDFTLLSSSKDGRVLFSFADQTNLVIGSQNIGIGTHTPQANLDVVGGTTDFKGAMRVRLPDMSLGLEIGPNFLSTIGSSQSRDFYLLPGGEGNVAIGTTATSSRLTVNGSIGLLAGGITFADGSSLASSKGPAYFSGIYNSGNITLGIDTDRSGRDALTFQSGGQSHFVMSSSGNIGIGTTDPRHKLEIRGSSIIGANFASNVRAPDNGLAVEGAVGIGSIPVDTKLSVAGSGSPTFAGSIAYFGSGPVAQAENFYGINIAKSGADSIFLGINKASQTGEILPDATFVSTGKASGTLILGRGDDNGRPHSADLMIDPMGNIGVGTTQPNFPLTVSSARVSQDFQESIITSMAYPGSTPKGGGFAAYRARGSATFPSAVLNGDNLGTYVAGGYDGSRFLTTSAIISQAVGTLAAGSLPTDIAIWTGASEDTLTEKVRVKSSGQVGIGTSMPASLLDVRGNVLTNSTIGWSSVQTVSPTVSTYITSPAENSLAIATNSLERLRIDPNGNVGIGSNSPTSRLDINGNVTITDKIMHFSDVDTAIRFPLADTITAETSGSERLRITPNGNVGIGTTAPSYQLTLAGNGAAFGVDNGAAFYARNSGGTYDAYLWPRWVDNVMYLNYGSSGFNIRNNSSTSTMFMTNAGYIGIGTTNPAGILMVRAAADRNFMISSSANVAGAFRLAAVNDANSAYTPLEIDASLTSFMTGNVGIATSAPSQLFSVGSASQFQIDGAGNVVRINNVPYSWPSSQGGAWQTISNNGGGSLSWTYIYNAHIANDAAISTSKLSGSVFNIAGHSLGELAALNSIGGDRINDGTVTSIDIADGTVTGTDIADGTVTGTDIADGTVTGTDIADATVTGTDIADATVTGSDIADGSVTGTDIADSTIGSADIADGTVTSADIADGNVTGTDIANGTITDADVAGGAAIATSKLNGSVFSIPGHGLGSLASQNSAPVSCSKHESASIAAGAKGVASCPGGKVPTGGGCWRDDGNYACLTRPTASGWECNNQATTASFTAVCHVICCNGSN